MSYPDPAAPYAYPRLAMLRKALPGQAANAQHRQLLARLGKETDQQLVRLRQLYRGDAATRRAIEAEQQWRHLTPRTPA